MGIVKIKPAVEVAAEQVEAAKRRLAQAVQSHMDDVARTRGYDGILSLCSYATSADATFSAEGQAGVQWRDDVWRYCYEELAKVESGLRSVPTEAELISELPGIGW